MESPLVWQTWAWWRSRSTGAVARGLGISSSKPAGCRFELMATRAFFVGGVHDSVEAFGGVVGEHVLAIEALCAAQGLDFRAPLRPGAGVAAAHDLVPYRSCRGCVVCPVLSDLDLHRCALLCFCLLTV